MITTNEGLINPDHLIRARIKKKELHLYITTTISDKTRYRIDPGSGDLSIDCILETVKKHPDFVKIADQDYVNRKHIAELRPVVDHELANYQIRVTTTENIENKKRKYQVINYTSYYKLMEDLKRLIGGLF